MSTRRLSSLAGRRAALPAALLLALAGCARSDAPHPPAAVAAVGAEAAAEALPSRAQVEAVRAGYRERLRLGLGSPFRLAEAALTDPRLDPLARRAAAAELIFRTLDGRLYEIDPAGLTPYLGAPRPADLARAQRHLELISETLESAPDPRAGELSVRLAYRLALAEGTVDSLTAPAAMQAAALLRDRALAREDARRLVRTARRHRLDPVDLLAPWRRAGHFAVESPALQATPLQLERQALEAVPLLARSVRAVRHQLPRAAPVLAPPAADAAALARLRALADAGAAPPEATVVTTLRRIGAALPEAPRAAAGWAELTATAWNEESFAAHYAVQVERAPALRPLLASAARQVAVGLRTSAQQRVWHPGMPHPSPEALQERYGVLVAADTSLPEAWLPATLVRLDDALGALRSVFPQLPMRGLRIEVTRESDIENALASHRPRTRTLQWPVTTGPGTLAHEIAHDLDWQAAHRGGLARHGYASDRVAERSGSFAAALATLAPSAPGRPTTHATRPAEVLARTFEWFVLTRLAARGQWDGTLSSAQDELLTGHGSLRPPRLSEAYGPAVLEALRPLTTIPEVEREGFLAEYGPLRWPRAYLLLRSLNEEMESSAADDAALLAVPGPRQRLAGIRAARDRALHALGGVGCAPHLVWADRALVDGYRTLVNATAAAHAAAVALRHAQWLAGDDGRRWMERELFGPLWTGADPDPAHLPDLAALAAAVRELEHPEREMFRSGFDFRAPAERCGAPLGR